MGNLSFPKRDFMMRFITICNEFVEYFIVCNSWSKNEINFREMQLKNEKFNFEFETTVELFKWKSV